MNSDESLKSASLARLTLSASIAGVFIAPRKTIPKLINTNGFWLPIIILSLLIFITQLSLLDQLRVETIEPEYIKNFAEEKNISEGEATKQLEAAKDLTNKFTPVMILIEAPFMVIIGIAGVSAILWLIGNIRFKQRQRFIYLLRISAWASIVGAIPLLFNIVFKLLGLDLFFHASPEFLLTDSLKNSYFYFILQSLDIFLIWQAWLMSIGIAALYKIPIEKAVTAVGTMYVVFIVLNAMILAAGN